VELGSDPVSIQIDVRRARQRLISAADSPAQTVLIQFEDISADKNPGASWEVYVGLPLNAQADPHGPHFVGAISLFAAGVRSEAHGQFQPTAVAFSLDKAIPAAFRNNASKLEVRFVPSGILINGKPSQPNVTSKVRIGRISLAIETRQRRR
jgi:hypothetical protein